MIQQNNMEIIVKRPVDNVIKNAVEEVKNENKSEKKLPLLSEAINKNDNSSKIIKSFHVISLKKVRNKMKFFVKFMIFIS